MHEPTTSETGPVPVSTVVNDVLARLGGLPAHQLDAGFDDVLASLGRALEVHRAQVFVISDDVCSCTHEWAADGVRRNIADLQEVPLERVRAWVPPLEAGDPVQVDDVAALPDDRADERDQLLHGGVASILVVPMRSFGELVGFVLFDSVTPRAFTDAERQLLRTVGEMLSATWVRREARSAVGRAQARLEELLRHIDDALILVDDLGVCQWASPSVASLGLDAGRLVGFTPRHLLVDESQAELRRAWAEFDGGAGAEIALDELEIVTPLGIRWIDATIRDLRHLPDVGGLLLVLRDITDQRHTRESTKRHARTDALTGLPNRTALRGLLDDALAEDGALGVLFLDIDRFKLINDARGHAMGDELLQQVAGRLARLARPGEVVARWGGDEFVLLLQPGANGTVAESVERYASAVRSPFFVGGEVHTTTASFGLRLRRPDERPGADALLRDADTALSVAKERGRDRLVTYDRWMGEVTVRRGSLLARLRTAVEDGLIVPHYQRIVDLRSGLTTGVEALARWEDPDLGPVSPAEFIPLAEETGLVVPLGASVLRRALADFVDWPEPITVSVNLSPRQLEQADLADTIIGALRDTGMPASRLRLEVTESLLVADATRARQVLDELRANGMSIALDDFGTGFSSLSVLRDLPLDVLKIDRTFVQAVDTDPVDRNLVSSIVDIAGHLGLGTIAEGIETAAQEAVLREAGCDGAQGWLHGRPAPATELLAQVVDERRALADEEPSVAGRARRAD